MGCVFIKLPPSPSVPGMLTGREAWSVSRSALLCSSGAGWPQTGPSASLSLSIYICTVEPVTPKYPVLFTFGHDEHLMFVSWSGPGPAGRARLCPASPEQMSVSPPCRPLWRHKARPWGEQGAGKGPGEE